jgi:hypothetical protein
VISEKQILDLLRGDRTAPILVGLLPDKLMSCINAKTNNIFISSHTALKQFKKHADLLPKEYLLIDLAIRYGEVRHQERYLRFIYDETVIFSRTYSVLVKSCLDGRELFMASFHRVRAQDVERLRRKSGDIVRRHYS